MATHVQLQDVSRLVDAALTLTGRSVEVAATQPHTEQSLALRVGALLIVRIMNDLRAALHSARIGYPVQSVALVTGLYEMAATVAFIGADEARAQSWLAHTDHTRTPWPVRQMAESMAASSGRNGDRLYERYRLLCMVKHGNPRFEREQISMVEPGRMQFRHGPDLSDHAQALAWFALLDGVHWVLLAQRTFVTDHVSPGPQQEELQGQSTQRRGEWETQRTYAFGRWPRLGPLFARDF
jgi:hypothetical protein